MKQTLVAAFIVLAALPALAAPPNADTAMTALNDSPRHGEFVHIPLKDSETKLKTWVVYPERADKAPVVLVIHEIFGLSDWVRSVADALAAEGYIAVAPDLLSGMEGAEENPRETISKLEDSEAIARLNAALDYAVALPAASGKAATMGFCWGGRMSFLYAGSQPKLTGAIVCYGTSPEKEVLDNISMPVLGLYAADDARVNATIDAAKSAMEEMKKPYEVNLYEGAGHGFFRQQDGRDGANLKAAHTGWTRALEFLKEHTE